ncbi:MAG: hypothetical protein FWC16_00255 [Defluviitaleaceae bacterium]|nr:hypothetical protein [Defluviitaleaceae bacterium]MCL2273334.1 hypothetical protein [Defluviitaleaceae bacterium]
MPMRLTGSMINNTTLMHINRNMRNLDGIIRTLETTKRVSRPSDDPLIASRALKFRAGVQEVRQFQRNVEFGQAWMNVTESAFINVMDNQLQEIRSLLVAGANGTYNVDNKATMINQIRQLVDHIGTAEMNQTFAGRFVFAGFRTDEQPVFTAANDRRFIITQHFGFNEVDRTASFQRLGDPASTPPGADADTFPPTAHNVRVIRLAYRNIDSRDADGNLIVDPNDPDFLANKRIEVPGFHVITRSINDPQAYLPAHTIGDLDPADPQRIAAVTAGVALTTPILHFVTETGELAMHDTTAAAFPREGISVTFEKTGFERGELNPSVYFTSREILSDIPEPAMVEVDRVYQVTQYLSRQAASGTATLNGAPAYSFELQIFGGGVVSPAFTDVNAPAALRPTLPPGAVLTPGSPAVVTIPASVFDRGTQISISYSVEIPYMGDTATRTAMHNLKTDTRVAGVTLIRASVPGVTPLTPIPLDQAESNRSFDMHDQIITIEAAAHNHVGINSLAKNAFTAEMFSDLRRFIEFVDGVVITEESELRRRLTENPPYYTEPMLTTIVDRQLIDERAVAQDALYTHFNNMLLLIDRHSDRFTREHTQLGARAQRLDMLFNRLEADEVTLERLTSDNEDTDMARAIMLRMNAETAFQASLRANAGIMQLNLSNFIN